MYLCVYLDIKFWDSWYVNWDVSIASSSDRFILAWARNRKDQLFYCLSKTKPVVDCNRTHIVSFLWIVGFDSFESQWLLGHALRQNLFCRAIEPIKPIVHWTWLISNRMLYWVVQIFILPLCDCIYIKKKELTYIGKFLKFFKIYFELKWQKKSVILLFISSVYIATTKMIPLYIRVSG